MYLVFSSLLKIEHPQSKLLNNYFDGVLKETLSD